MSEPQLLEPGEVYELRIDLWATANVFRAGHRIRLDISSSNFPRFDRNTNTGRTIATDGPEALVEAVNRVFHDRRATPPTWCCRSSTAAESRHVVRDHSLFGAYD